MMEASKFPSKAESFPETRWSIVLRVSDGQPDESTKALEDLCRGYWHPIYAYVRRRGYAKMEAEDLTQGFFSWLLEKQTFHRAREDRGKLRTFLLTNLKYFIADETRRKSALKRGGGIRFVPLDGECEQLYLDAFGQDESDPATLFQRAWAKTLITTVTELLHQQYTQSGKGDMFKALSSHLYGSEEGIPYESLASNLGASISAMRLNVFRMRQKFRALLESEIVQTLESRKDLEEEIAFLFTVV